MDFLNGQTLYRHRYPLIPDPYNPTSKTSDYSANPVTIPLQAAFISSSSSVAGRDATRAQILTEKSLYLRDVMADVQVGDRIGTTDVPTDAEYQLDVIPVADVNPFTGWQPVKEIPLEGVTG